MKHLLFLFAVFAASSPAFAEFGFDDGVRKPQTMMVAGNSVIDTESKTVEPEKKVVEDPSPQDHVSTLHDDASNLSNPKTAAPIQPEIDAFQPAPTVETKKSLKRVLKKIPAANSQRSIADDRIDDSYVQDMMKNDFSFTPDMVDSVD